MGEEERVVRVVLQRFDEQGVCLRVLPRGLLVDLGQGLQIGVVGGDAARPLPARSLDLRCLDLGRDEQRDVLGDAILEVEDVADRAVETLGPEVGPGRPFDELGADAGIIGVADMAAAP